MLNFGIKTLTTVRPILSCEEKEEATTTKKTPVFSIKTFNILKELLWQIPSILTMIGGQKKKTTTYFNSMASNQKDT